MNAETPMMQQYKTVKDEHQDAIVFFRLGDFYEMFFEDAKEAASLLSLVLTARNGVPMCGIPYHASKGYIKRLIDAGKKIAICEQTELPDKGKKLARREVVQIITPGTVIEDDFLDSANHNFICCLSSDDHVVACAYCDVSTGDFYLTHLSSDGSYDELKSILQKINPSEIIVPEAAYYEDTSFRQIVQGTRAMKTTYPDWYFSQKDALETLKNHFGSTSLKQFGIDDNHPALPAAGALYNYIAENARQHLSNISALTPLSKQNYVLIDESAQKNLELVRNLQDGGASGTLFSVLRQTKTSAGARLLRSWIVYPITDVDQIKDRQQQVTRFYQRQDILTAVREAFKRVLDLQRISSRILLQRAAPRDLQALSQTIKAVLQLFATHSDFFSQHIERLSQEGTADLLWQLSEHIDSALIDELPSSFEEGNIIQDRYSDELDRLRTARDDGSKLLDDYLRELKEETGITNIKLKSNKIIGHFLEVSKSQSRLVPDTFLRKQTLVQGERYTTEKLIELERTIAQAKTRSEQLEKQLYQKLLSQAASSHAPIIALSRLTAEIDVYQSLAYAAMKYGYSCPQFTPENRISIEHGRHPVVEAMLEQGAFVPNSLEIPPELRRTALITGPNMSGKSTFLRQTALIVLMAHIGSYVPADSAVIGTVDKIFCRVGAADNLARGESTFLVEMNETAFILRNATKESLVIMDEVGRGTSTRDGLSIAYAVMQKLLHIGSKTLFATHYHELTQQDVPGLQKLFLDIARQGGKMVFLKKIREGVAASSYGIHAAELAGVPPDVLAVARSYQQQTKPTQQMNLFDEAEMAEEKQHAIEQEVAIQLLQRLSEVSLEQTTPLQALELLYALKDIANEHESDGDTHSL
ncbi:MAG: DNA mismatch repair protein MutS [Spirochaetota bacterium]